MVEAVVCASCPESYHDRVAELCLQHQVQKTRGKAGDMVNALSGKDWILKWEAKVVMATVTKAQTLNSNKALILCIVGGKHCDAEMARQPALVRAIKTEMASQEFRVRVEFIEISEFLERYPDIKSNTSTSTKENGKPKDGKGGKDTQDGAKIITRPFLPAPVPSKPNLSHLHITRAVVPVPLPHVMLRGDCK